MGFSIVHRAAAFPCWRSATEPRPVAICRIWSPRMSSSEFRWVFEEGCDQPQGIWGYMANVSGPFTADGRESSAGHGD